MSNVELQTKKPRKKVVYDVIPAYEQEEYSVSNTLIDAANAVPVIKAPIRRNKPAIKSSSDSAIENDAPIGEAAKPVKPKRAPAALKKKASIPVLDVPTPEVSENIGSLESVESITHDLSDADDFVDILVESFLFNDNPYFIDANNRIFHHSSLALIGHFHADSNSIQFI